MKNITTAQPTITQSSFGLLQSGEEAHLFTLTNANNVSLCITNYGGAITSLNVKNNKGHLADVVLGYDSVEGYEKDTDYLGAIIGRYAGRVKNGKVKLPNQLMQLSLNHEPNHEPSQLHGGKKALNKQLWQAKTSVSNNSTSTDSVSLTLTHTSPDGDNGFAGEVSLCVKYSLTNKNEIYVEYSAKTNKTTLLNLTQHSYFNLAGHDQGSILTHQVQLNAEHFLPMTTEAYPTGELKSVKNTPHDFTALTTLSEAITPTNAQIQIANGYDNYWLLKRSNKLTTLNTHAAQVVEPRSGRRLTLYTDQPSIILYTGNGLSGALQGKNNTYYLPQHGLCLEPQRAFDYSLTNENYQPFTTCILEPEKPFYSKSIYVFDTV